MRTTMIMTDTFSRCRSTLSASRRLPVTHASSPAPLDKKHNEARVATSRRTVLTLPAVITGTVAAWDVLPALAIITPPPGFKSYSDVLDGYQFFVKDDWLPVTSTGNDVAYRSLRRPDQNLFVTISSPSTSQFSTMKDVGTVEDAGDSILRQYLKEFMSTRIGVVREGEFVSGAERVASDGKTYYDIEVMLRSYASRNQLAVTQEERQRSVELEWERRLFTVVGVANKRKYEFRLQADKNANTSDLETLQFMADSFRCYEPAAVDLLT